MFIRSKKYVLTIALALVCAGLVLADNNENCQTAIKNQVHKNNQKVQEVVFHADSNDHETKSRTETVYKGEGEFQRHTGKWESFSWECSYDTKNGKVNDAHYSVSNSESHPEAGSSVPRLKDLEGARAGQAEGEVKRRGYHWIKSDGAYSYWREESTDYCVTIRTDDGRYKSIAYATKVDCNE